MSARSDLSYKAPMPSLNEVKLEGRSTFSKLQLARRAATSLLPSVFKAAPNLAYETHEALGAVADHADIEKAFPKTYGRARISLKPATGAAAPKGGHVPLRVACVLSGGQAPGGHNVIAGIYDYIKKVHVDSVLIGFMDGPAGIYNGQYCVVTDKLMDDYRNSGGFDMIGSGRHKIEKPKEFADAMANCVALDLDGLVVIGGDDSNTNAAVLAEYFEANGCKTKVCGAPKTIDGDLKVDPYIPISFGFDTACRTYSEEIGNLGHDTLGSQKYYHFVRLMGRAASNIALECALQTRPNVCLISEEVEQKKMTLSQITQEVVQVIVDRAAQGKDYGIVLLPEGLIEFIPEFNALINEINDVLASGVETTEAAVTPHLSFNNRAVFAYLPDTIKQQLLLDRDPHGNVQVAKIETEKLLAQTVNSELALLRRAGKYNGSFFPVFHSYGYEGRSGLPSAFDATYCYVLGQTVGAMIALGLNGLISSVTNLNAPVSEWRCGGVPITMMCHMEKRHGHMKPVIKKALVEMDGEPFKVFAKQRADWAMYDLYRSPGPLQYFSGKASVELCITLTLELAKTDVRVSDADLQAAIAGQRAGRRFGAFWYAPAVGAGAAHLSALQKERASFFPSLCRALASASGLVEARQATQCPKVSDQDTMRHTFAHTYGARLVSFEADDGEMSIGNGNGNGNGHSNGHGNGHMVAAPRRVVSLGTLPAGPVRLGLAFFGRQSPGGHDLLAGLYDSLASYPAGSSLVGFVGGALGLVANHAVPITAETLAAYRGCGGFEQLARSIETLEATNFAAIAAACDANHLDGLVLAGGARTHTVAAYLAEYLAARGCPTKVVCVPVGTSGSFKNAFVETTVGFNTSTKVAGQLAGNNATDGASAKKYYYFMRLMGAKPSHSTLEVALLTRPNWVILAEEVRERNMTLADVVRAIADMVQARAANGKNYGTVLIPEGLVESIPELKLLISEIDAAMDEAGKDLSPHEIRAKLTLWSRALLESLPDFMQYSLLLSRGSDRGLQVSQAETERLLAHFVELELGYRKKKGTYKGSFAVVCSFIGYQTRGANPSNFDISLAYNLGFAASKLVVGGFSGYMATIGNLKAPQSEWQPMGVPITALMSVEKTKGQPVCAESEVDLQGPAFLALEDMRKACTTEDLYENPGPTQYSGPAEVVDSLSLTLTMESFEYLSDLKKLQGAISRIEEACRPGCSARTLHIATLQLQALTELIDLLNHNDSPQTHAAARTMPASFERRVKQKVGIME